MKRILCIWLPEWPIQRLVAAQTELSRRAIVLYAPHSRGRRVAACSAAALARGVRVGMPLAEATSLVAGSKTPGRSNSPHVQLHDGRADRAALEQLATWCEQFSPLVGLEAAEQPESLLLDVTGLGVLFGGEGGLAGKVAQKFRRRGYAVRLAIADTVGAAWAAAHFEAGSEERRAAGAEQSGGAAGDPQGAISVPHSARPFVMIPPGEGLAAVGHFPVESLRLPGQTTKLLHQLGVSRIEQLARLPRAGLASRFGGELVQRLDQAAGVVQEIIVPYRPPPELKAHWPLEHPTAHREAIERIVSQLVERLAGQLAERERGATQLECRLDCVGGEPVSVRVGFFQPTAAPQHWLELVRMQLELLAAPGAVENVHVEVTASAPLAQRQYELFADAARSCSRRLAALVDRLSSRLGRQCVVRPQLQDDAQPELAYRYVPLTGEQPPNSRSPAGQAEQRVVGSLQRPLRLYCPPWPLDVVCIAPDGPPIAIHYQNGQHDVARRWGPERIETGWWRGPSVRRDYYRVETRTGAWFWLFRRLQDGKWFLHGEFE